MKIDETTARIKQLHGKYLNDTINPKELKEFISKSMANRGNVSLKEMGNRFRNYKDSLPGDDKTKNVTGEVYDAFAD